MSNFDLRYISLGAGVQSTTLYLLAARGEIGPKPDCAIFADTQAEPPWVYENLDRLEAMHGDAIPVHRVTAGSLTDAVERGSRTGADSYAPVPFWVASADGRPMFGRRQCTREFKIDVIKSCARRLIGVSKGERIGGRRAEEWIGISIDEAHRAKPSRYSWITVRWPLLFDRPMRRGECLRWLKEIGYPTPLRSACWFCPYHGDSEWVDLRDNAPDLWEAACSLDERLRDGSRQGGMRGRQFIHRSLVPLREVVLKETDPRQTDLFGNECEGMCGV